MGNAMSPEFKTEEEYFQASVRKDSNRNSFFGGRLGLGDPGDKFLYRTEVKIGLPAKRKEIILDEYCSKSNEDFLACKEQNKILSRFRCKKEKLERTACLSRFWNLSGLEERAYNEYLAARSHFRQTGESQNKASLQKKTWEQYKATKDDHSSLWNSFCNLMREQKSPEQHAETKNDNPTLWSTISNTWRRQKPPDVSVPTNSEPLTDS